ncbi:hypothetical protein K435DRAFT_840608 [Dendrothele bispora CBS 962.96]|uniref:Uncharacterized protein n=1 Tax=Dendrothele bispora (strain CBS 962.96) TaxID=1314807 RepID=A0A4S8LTE9_DENBC|nr:hypothetical protein K435DRAFT_840608 [Dendrothele bispora CBS 962.96]
MSDSAQASRRKLLLHLAAILPKASEPLEPPPSILDSQVIQTILDSPNSEIRDAVIFDDLQHQREERRLFLSRVIPALLPSFNAPIPPILDPSLQQYVLDFVQDDQAIEQI